jgi:hypothetical protein
MHVSINPKIIHIGGCTSSVSDRYGPPNPSKHQMENDPNEETIESLVTQFNNDSKVAAEHLVRKFRTVWPSEC